MTDRYLWVVNSAGSRLFLLFLILLPGGYVLAKICEHFDREIFGFLKFWSGHTIKHFLGAVSLFYANWSITYKIRLRKYFSEA